MTVPKYFIDTNIFLRIIAKDDPRKVRDCERLIQMLLDGKIKGVVSKVVLAEFVWTCLSFYKLSKSEVVKAVQAIVSIKNLIIVDRGDVLQAIDLFGNNKVKFIDALIASLEYFKHEESVIISYDKDFDKLGIKRLEPREIL